MTFKFDGYNWLARLQKGELLVDQLTKLIQEQNITGAWISGLGAAMWAELGFYDLGKKQYAWKKIGGPIEITSLQGNIAWQDDKPVLHIHGSFSDHEMRAYGGHLKELQVAGACEILLHRWYKEGLSRALDEDTGLNLLNI